MSVTDLDTLIWTPSIIRLGVLGSTNKITPHVLMEQVLNPILQELGRIPDEVLVPFEGDSSIYIQEWAKRLAIRTKVYEADWKRSGRAAQIIRDSHIQKECTHAIVFLGLRTARYAQLSEKMVVKQGKEVFTVLTNKSNDPLTVEQLVSEEPLLPLPRPKVSGRKSSTRKEHSLPRGQMQIDSVVQLQTSFPSASSQ